MMAIAAMPLELDLVMHPIDATWMPKPTHAIAPIASDSRSGPSFSQWSLASLGHLGRYCKQREDLYQPLQKIGKLSYKCYLLPCLVP